MGPAFTLRYIPAREDLNQLTEFRKSDHPQRVAIETCPAGSVIVFDSRKDPRAARRWGYSHYSTSAKMSGRSGH